MKNALIISLTAMTLIWTQVEANISNIKNTTTEEVFYAMLRDSPALQMGTSLATAIAVGEILSSAKDTIIDIAKLNDKEGK